MAILILVFCFTAIFLNLAAFAGDVLKKREMLLASVLIFCLLLLFFTELLSFFGVLNFAGIFLCWCIASSAGFISLHLNRHKLRGAYYIEKQLLKDSYNSFNRADKLLLALACGMLVLLFVQGVMYPPNNWDAMTYHLARVSSWVSQGSVAYYPTHILRQLYQPPFAEFVILHINILTGADYFSNLVQLVYLLFTVIAITCLLKALKLNRKFQILAVLLCLTIPEVVLQASGAQNDLVAAFFIITAIYFSYKAFKKVKLKYYVFAGLAAGFALLTKGTAYIYMAPVVLIFGGVLLYKIFMVKRSAYLTYGIIAVLMMVLVNAPAWGRNYNLNGTLLGIDKKETSLYATEGLTPGLLVSNIIKNFGLHTGIKFTGGRTAALADSVIHKMHAAAGVDINSRGLNYQGIPYSTQSYATHEDSAPNLLHFLIIITAFGIAVAYGIKRKLSIGVVLLGLIIMLQVVLFSGYLKWQPWHSRLHVPMFLLAIPFVCYVAALSSVFKKALYVLMPALLLYALVVISYNELRKLKPENISRTRFEKYFAARPDIYTEYLAVKQQINVRHYKNIGLFIGEDDWQYPLFYDGYIHELNPVHIHVNNYSKHLQVTNKTVDCIISTQGNSNTITYRGRVFYNQTPGNKRIHLYK